MFYIFDVKNSIIFQRGRVGIPPSRDGNPSNKPSNWMIELLIGRWSMMILGKTKLQESSSREEVCTWISVSSFRYWKLDPKGDLLAQKNMVIQSHTWSHGY